MSSASNNDISLFPLLANNAALRARAISRSVKEMKRVPVKDAKLKKIIDDALKKFVGRRNIGQVFVKKSKLDTQTLNAATTDYAEFKPLVPYLELSYPSQKDGPPGHPPKNSLLNVYWKMRTSTVEEPRLNGRKYWE